MTVPAPNYTQTPNDLFDHWLPHLGGVELKVLMVIMRQTFGWHKTREKISLSFFQKLTGSNRTNICNALNALIEKGLVSKEIVGDLGIEETYYELVVDDGGSTNSVPPGPSTNSVPPLVPKEDPSSLGDNTYRKEKTQRKGIVLDDDLTLPSASAESKGKTKYPLKKSQLPAFEALKSVELEADDDTLKILVRTYSQEKIINAVFHLNQEIEKGTAFKKGRIQFLRHLLNGKASVISKTVSDNRKRLEEALKLKPWPSLEIHEKYIICRNCLKEVPFDLEKKEFDLQLNTLYEMSKSYGN